MDKYDRALDLMDAVIAANAENRYANSEWDDLYTFIFEHFERPVSSDGHLEDAAEHREWAAEIDECAAMFTHDRETILAFLRSKPPGYTDAQFPISVARYLLWIGHVRVDPMKTSTFDEFYNRYKVMILCGCEKKYVKSS